MSSSNKRFGELKAKNLIVWTFSFSTFAAFYIRLYPRGTGQIFDQSKIHAVRYSVKIRDGFKILAGMVDNITGTVWTPRQSEFSNVKAFSWMVQCKKGERESLSWSSYFPVSKRQHSIHFIILQMAMACEAFHAPYGGGVLESCPS